MFSTEEFIEASRNFVCIRIETFENKESEQLVKKVLNGRYANTAFAIINPQGTKQLTRGGRSPSMAMSDNRGKTDRTGSENDEIIAKMMRIAKQYEPKGGLANTKLQDFHSLRQALNCASADQRLLVFVNTPEGDRGEVEGKLQTVFTEDDVVGKFHLDFVNARTDKGWTNVLSDEKNKPSIMVIRSGQFGTKGKVLEQVSLDSSEEEIKETLLKANKYFAKVEKRKDYEQHVREGRREGVTFENEISRKGTSDGPDSRRKNGKSDRRKRRRGN